MQEQLISADSARVSKGAVVEAVARATPLAVNLQQGKQFRTQKCRLCSEIKGLSEFYCYKHIDKYHTACIACTKKRAKEKRRVDKELKRQSMKVT